MVGAGADQDSKTLNGINSTPAKPSRATRSRASASESWGHAMLEIETCGSLVLAIMDEVTQCGEHVLRIHDVAVPSAK